MAISVVINGTTYSIPSKDEVGWAASLNALLVALAAAARTFTDIVANSITVKPTGQTQNRLTISNTGSASWLDGSGNLGVQINSAGIVSQQPVAANYAGTDIPALVVTGDVTSPVKAAFVLVPMDGEPTGLNAAGSLYVTSAGVLKICTVTGTPGTWVSVGAQT